MHVLLDCRMATWTGIGRYATGLARELAGREDIRLTIVKAAGDASPVPAHAVTMLDAHAHPFQPAGGFELGRLARAARPDVVHCLHFPTPIPAVHPLAVTIHDLTPLIVPAVMNAFPHRVGYRLWTARAARVADAILADSESTARDIARFFPAAAAKTTVVLLTAEGFADGPVGPLPSGLVPGGARYLLSMGNTKTHKGLPTLLRAFESIAERHPRLLLLLVGRDAPGFADATIRDPAVAARVRFTGAVGDAEIRALYAGAELFAFPSTHEGFGLPPLEAMAFGTPVVCSSAASLPEVVGDAALLFPPGDDAALAGAIEAVLGDASVRARLRAAGPPRAASFTWKRTGDGTLAVYRMLVGCR